MKTVVAFALFSYSLLVNAQTARGTFTATEVEPIRVREFVSETCYRSQDECQTVCDYYGENCGPMCNTFQIPYECGVTEWVRRGSRPVYELEVEYEFNFFKISPNLKADVEVRSKEIDKGFTKEQFLKVFKASTEKAYFYAQDIKFEERSLSPSTKRIHISATANLLDPSEVNKTITNKTTFLDKSHLKLADELPLEAIDLEICVGQDRRLSWNMRDLGCQKISSRDVNLSKISFESASARRSLVYSFNWKMKGQRITDTWHISPTLDL